MQEASRKKNPSTGLRRYPAPEGAGLRGRIARIKPSRAQSTRGTSAREISNRIDELRTQLDELLAQAQPELDQLHRQRRALADVWRAKRTAAAQEVQKQFPDLAGPARFSAAAWQPPAEVLAEMEAAAQAVEATATRAQHDQPRGS
jgi:hypothetical protein